MRKYLHDYSLPGDYFVTICTRNRALTLADRRVARIVHDVWSGLPDRWRNVDTDAFVIMPNHVHGIIVVGEKPDPGETSPDLGEIVRTFKAAVTRAARAGGVADFAWQRNYYDHIIRTSESPQTIREYIRDNPARWAQDRDNPDGEPDIRERAFWRRFGGSSRRGAREKGDP